MQAARRVKHAFLHSALETADIVRLETFLRRLRQCWQVRLDAALAGISRHTKPLSNPCGPFQVRRHGHSIA